MCQSHTVVTQVAEGDFSMWDSNYFDGNSRLATAGVNSQLRPLGRCRDETLSLVQSLTIQNQNSSRWNVFPDGGATNEGKILKGCRREGGASGGNSTAARTAERQWKQPNNVWVEESVCVCPRVRTATRHARTHSRIKGESSDAPEGSLWLVPAAAAAASQRLETL